MTLEFSPSKSLFNNVATAVSSTTGFTYEVHDKWKVQRGVGYAVFVRDCATGKTTTGNKAAFYSRSTSNNEAVKFCERHNREMTQA